MDIFHSSNAVYSFLSAYWSFKPMVCATIIPNIGDFLVIVGIGIFLGMIWMIQQAKSCTTAIIDVVLIIAAGILITFFVLMVNKYF